MCDARAVRVNLAITGVVCALALALWFGALRPDDTQDAREQGAKTYCEELLRHGLLHEPMAQCMQEYKERSR